MNPGLDRNSEPWLRCGHPDQSAFRRSGVRFFVRTCFKMPGVWDVTNLRSPEILKAGSIGSFST